MSTPSAAARLADAILDTWFNQPTSALLPPERLAHLLRELLLGHLRSPRADERTHAWVLAAQQLCARKTARLRELLPAEGVTLLYRLAAHPYMPDRALLTRLLAREPLRRLNRELMVNMMLEHSRRLRTSLSKPGPEKGLSALGRLASGAVKKSTSALGAIAPGVTAAVADEFERQLQRRAGEFADGAVDDLGERLTILLTDPARAAEHAELKRALLDFALDLSGPQIAQELARLQPATLAATLRATARSWLEREAASTELARVFSWLVAQTQDRTLGTLLFELLGDTPLMATVRAALHEFLTSALHPLLENGILRHLLAHSDQ